MRITFLSPRSNLSGGLRVIAIHAQMLQDRGHEVSIVVPAKRQVGAKTQAKTWAKSLIRGRLPDREPDEGGHFDQITVPIVEAGRDDFLFTHDDIPDGDALIATWWETAFSAAAMPPSKGRPYYLIQHHEVHDFLPWQISRSTYYLPLKHFVVSNWLGQVMASEYGQNDAVLVPNGVDLSHFSAPPRDKQDHPTVGLLYSTNAIKGTGTLLQAIEQIRAALPDLRVRAFGAEPMSDDLPLPPGSDYLCRPEQAQIPALYAGCDLFLCGSTSEGYFLPLLEAMACGCPLVSTDVGAAQDLITPGVNGAIVDVGDAAAIADHALRILKAPNADWQAMSQVSRDVAAAHTWAHACDRLETALREAS
ncbi:D-inositol 3-phosphate glycosyltransferase [Falsiruegeria litorea R37]|uniref:D-inositol 3-phosphate glycosyltransferase n=1 Tax=Falsiruegeria litorea R37 TaxID=1200284 RepID=A0A1Y5T0J5_9RHOB|nr:glycosyltransferase family 4 protein [Falsiruegeria litorea]SLN53428.1 D-inositol 3-phosphate glycosyltransferase [Falsiruegeria litorea R37]